MATRDYSVADEIGAPIDCAPITGVKLAAFTAPLQTAGMFCAVTSTHVIVDIAETHVSIDDSELVAVELHLLRQHALVPLLTQSATVPDARQSFTARAQYAFMMRSHCCPAVLPVAPGFRLEGELLHAAITESTKSTNGKSKPRRVMFL